MSVPNQPHKPTIILFGRDLRLADNDAVIDAAATGQPLVPLYIDVGDEGPARPLGGASKWWRGQSLQALDKELRQRGSRLILRRGEMLRVLEDVLHETGASSLHFHWRRDPGGVEIDRRIEALCRKLGVDLAGHAGNHLHDPAHLKTGSGGAFRVFTPFWNRLLGHYSPPSKRTLPTKLRAPEKWPRSDEIASIAVTDAWTRSLAQHWAPGERGAKKTLDKFIAVVGTQYSEMRDRPDIVGTSRLSPYLAWGELSVHEVWRRLHSALGGGAMPYLRQLGWRDFNMHLMASFGDLSRKPIRAEFTRFPFVRDKKGLIAWQRGRTGFPIVDAGMRELWSTGWMHNRVRMIAASFLVKDLMIDWREGEAWFWDTLVDADPSQNPGNWQWVAGCGADAAPYFRIFNPVTQARRFDAKGDYVRRWVPELSRLSDEHIHAPHEAPPLELEEAGVRLGRDYPFPIVDHASARVRALAAYKSLGKED